MRKRERENPCGVCGHYHKYEEGEVCGICGHRIPASTEKSGLQTSAFPSEILPEFLYLGSYDNASRAELLKTQGISRVLNVRVFFLQFFFSMFFHFLFLICFLGFILGLDFLMLLFMIYFIFLVAVVIYWFIN